VSVASGYGWEADRVKIDRACVWGWKHVRGFAASPDRSTPGNGGQIKLEVQMSKTKLNQVIAPRVTKQQVREPDEMVEAINEGPSMVEAVNRLSTGRQESGLHPDRIAVMELSAKVREPDETFTRMMAAVGAPSHYPAPLDRNALILNAIGFMLSEETPTETICYVLDVLKWS
jgi:hypothetical protein